MTLQFDPNFFIRNPHVQTILSSQRKPSNGDMVKCEKLINIRVTADEVVRLNGYYSSQTTKKAKGLAILLHGWLGSEQSSYMLARGEKLYQAGYDVFRLNMRDHSSTVSLNKGIFHGGRLTEVYEAVKHIAELKPHLPVYVVGFSMGGSFALRVGWQHSIENMAIKNLKKIIAVCPSINPEQVTDAIDRSMIYRRYFCAKWKENLKEKQKNFPDLYDFTSLLSLNNCKQITEAIIKKYSNYSDIDDYFSDYQFTKEKLDAVKVPMVVLTSADDPVIPVACFEELKNTNPLFSLNITSYGGHVGFLHDFLGRSWLDEAIPYLIEVD